MKKGLKIVLIVILVILLIVVAAIWIFVGTIRKGATPIVAAPTATAEVAEAEAPAAESTPEIGEGDVVSLDTVETDASDAPIYETDQKADEIINILMVGGDARRSAAPTIGNSDTIMVASVNKTTKVITLVSFARDSYMQLQGDKGRYWNKLNAAYPHGGFGRLINTLNADYNYGLDIQYYVGVGFRNFEKLIDAIGGLDVYLTKEEAYYINWRNAGLLKADDKSNYWKLLEEQEKWGVIEEDGMHTLNGEQALWYARDRSTGDGETESSSGNDFVRTSRQQKVLELVFHKVCNEISMKGLYELAQFTMQNAKTNMTLDMMIELGAFLLGNKDAITIKKVHMPEEGTWTYGEEIIPPAVEPEDAVSVVKFDVKKQKERLHAILYEGAAASDADANLANAVAGDAATTAAPAEATAAPAA